MRDIEPDSEANQKASRENAAAIKALQAKHCACSEHIAEDRERCDTCHSARLYDAAKALVYLLEGVGCKRWAFEGRRLKDTKEWAEFYVATANAQRPEHPAL